MRLLCPIASSSAGMGGNYKKQVMLFSFKQMQTKHKDAVLHWFKLQHSRAVRAVTQLTAA